MGPTGERAALGAPARRHDHPLRPDARCSAATATPGATNGPSSMRDRCRAQRLGSARGCRADSRWRSRTIRISPAPNWSRFCETGGASVGITFDTGNTFPVAEAPLAFTRTIAPLCAPRASQGLPGAVHRRGLSAGALRHRRRRRAVPRRWSASLAEHHGTLTAVLEPGALEARHVRLLHRRLVERLSAEDGARRSPRACRPRGATAAGRCRLPHAVGARQDDARLVDYELDMIRRSAANMRGARAHVTGDKR